MFLTACFLYFLYPITHFFDSKALFLQVKISDISCFLPSLGYYSLIGSIFLSLWYIKLWCIIFLIEKSFLIYFILFFIYFWLRCVLVAAHGLSLVVASGLLIVVASLVVEHGL